MEIGIVGKPNVGKSTFFSACTMVNAEIASYPFTTIEPNKGICYVRAVCPHKEFKVQCNPKNAKCENGVRFIPVKVIDVAGLVPDAHKGRGLGNKFLDDLRQAQCLIHIVDASGSTDEEGNPVERGSHDPVKDIMFLENEISQWINGIISRGWDKLAREAKSGDRKIERLLAERLTGLNINEYQIKQAMKNIDLPEECTDWNEEHRYRLSQEIRKIGMPIIIAANKCDIASDENINRLMSLDNLHVISTSAESELALRKASAVKLLKYTPGSPTFKVIHDDKLSDKQRKALEKIKKVMEKFNGTGVQKCIEETVFKILGMIVVYPVEDEHKLCDKDGNVLPDAYLMRRGSTAKELAYKIHTDLGNHFIRAINVRTHRVIGADYELRDGDVIKIVADI